MNVTAFGLSSVVIAFGLGIFLASLFCFINGKKLVGSVLLSIDLIAALLFFCAILFWIPDTW